MAISIACGCGKRLKVGDGLAGKKVKCPGCGAALDVEAPAAAPRASEAGYALPRKFASREPAVDDAPAAPAPAPQASGKIVWFLGIFLTLFGSVFAWVGWHLIGKASAAKTWPSVEGRIDRSEVVSKEERDSKGKTSIMYSADIVYSYVVKGKSYQSNRVSPGGMTSSSSSSSWAKADAGKYPTGSKAVVHYDPSDPNDACLETDAGAGPWIFLLVGVAVLAGGGAILGFRIRAMLRPA